MVRAVALAREVVELVAPLFATAGYVVVPVAVFLETFAMLGVFVPGDVILALGGASAAAGDLDVVAVATLGVVASWAGSVAGFWLGARYGRRVVARLPFSEALGRKVDAAERFFDRHGGKAIVLGRFAVGVAGLIPFVAGAARFPLRRFLASMMPVVAVWAILVTAVGYAIGRNLDAVDRVISRIGWIGWAVVVTVALGAWTWTKLRRSRQDEDRGEDRVPAKEREEAA